ncbi:peptidylprolyl isomerase [Glacieibacterium frigidum]|uniref:peptidylprolyl isomerase n=1 Tax=Glacieibacterium frigidum TaxID=2593303 RepID=A0A552UH23_9SPHN|nr:peptidylprolyl isomerase [Glacieibacterium frigidum]TRW17522.1 peptidylprolyl isomerase [Glacieibacterium frigidum]
MIRTLLLALLAAAPAFAQAPEAPPAPPAAPPEAAAPPASPAPPPVVVPPPAPAKVYATTRVTLKTALGPIVIALEKQRAPVSTAYFLKYIDGKRLDGAEFYRAMKVAPDGSVGLVQGGVRDPKKLLPPVAHEPTSKTGLSHTDGAISLARAAPGTATANFFIIVGTLTGLDAGGGDKDGYAVFGHVVEGMDVVRRILAVPVSKTKGVGVMKGQMIEAPVKITTARRG